MTKTDAQEGNPPRGARNDMRQKVPLPKPWVPRFTIAYDAGSLRKATRDCLERCRLSNAKKPTMVINKVKKVSVQSYSSKHLASCISIRSKSVIHLMLCTLYMYLPAMHPRPELPHRSWYSHTRPKKPLLPMPSYM